MLRHDAVLIDAIDPVEAVLTKGASTGLEVDDSALRKRGSDHASGRMTRCRDAGS